MSTLSLEQLLAQAREHLKAARFAAAEQSCRTILAAHPQHPLALQMLGVALAGQGKLDDAIGVLGDVARLRPASPEAQYNLGKALQDRGRRDEAIAAYQRAIALRPDYAQARTNLGIALHETGKLDEAINEYRVAVHLRANSPEAHYNLANALKDAFRIDDAVAEYRRALQLRPRYAEAHANLGNALFVKGEIDEARRHADAAIEINPEFAEAHNLLGNLAKEPGRLDEALEHYRRALSVRSDAWALGNFLYTLHFHPDADGPGILREHRLWNEKYVVPLAGQIRPHTNDRSRDRRLRIGYVSAHLRRHPVGRFLLPLFAHHDHKAFEIFCYSGDSRRDEVTDRLQRGVDVWRSSVGVSDEQLAAQIHQDQIDILVDLAMHTDNSRLLTFARMPAPVQVTYLAYVSTTGVETIDYRLTDPYLDPFDEDRPFYCEQSVWLPRTYWCYDPPAEAPEPGPLPAIAAAHITFGCLNNFAKVSAATLRVWAQILAALPCSRLLLHCPEGEHRRRILDDFAARGVDPARVELIARMPFERYFELHNRIDVALDPFPYAGGTTTCDALWMGVPVVSLFGQTAVSRAGLSILTNVGLPKLVTATTDAYGDLAISLARDLPRLAELRRTLRPRMRQSALMDAPQFARDVEAAYRTMWEKWCEQTR